MGEKRSIMIFVPFNVPSSKNSQIKTSRGMFRSKTVSKYLSNIGVQHYSSAKKEVKEYKTKPNLFKISFEQFNWQKPTRTVKLGLHFVRGTKHKFDFGNISQIILDLMTAHDFIEDDNMDYVIPMAFTINNQWYSYSKDKPGVYIKLLK